MIKLGLSIDDTTEEVAAAASAASTATDDMPALEGDDATENDMEKVD